MPRLILSKSCLGWRACGAFNGLGAARARSESCSTSAAHSRAARRLRHGVRRGQPAVFSPARWRGGLKEPAAPNRPSLAALGHERSKALGFRLAQVEVIGQPGLAAGEAGRKAPGARAEG